MTIHKDQIGTLRQQSKGHEPILFGMAQHHNPQQTDTVSLTTGNCNTVRGDTPLTMNNETVRRLTPEECEAAQGFQKGWTKIPYKGKPADKCPDGPRYKAIGNSWAVPCANWIGRRIQMVEDLMGSPVKNQKRGDNKMLQKLERLVDLAIVVLEKYAASEVKETATLPAEPPQEKKTRKPRTPKEETPTQPTANKEIEDALGLGPTTTAPEQEEVPSAEESIATYNNAITTAKAFIELFKNATPTGYAQATDLVRNVYKVEKITDLSYRQQLEFIKTLNEKIAAKK